MSGFAAEASALALAPGRKPGSVVFGEAADPWLPPHAARNDNTKGSNEDRWLMTKNEVDRPPQGKPHVVRAWFAESKTGV
jgi:hypothetical protein